MSRTKKIGNTFVWILLSLLILGLAGFGATNFSSSVSAIGSVGETEIDVAEYTSALDQRRRAVEQQRGTPVGIQDLIQSGDSQAIVAQLFMTRALDEETRLIGLSVGDASVQKQILEIPAFKSINGEFDRESYRYALRNQGMTEMEFEAGLRRETARNILAGAIVGGTTVPDVFAQKAVTFLGEKRSFTWAKLRGFDIKDEIADPADDVLTAFFDENKSKYTLPEVKKLTYALLSIQAATSKVTVSDDALKAAYEKDPTRFNTNDQRILDRLGFASAEDAAAAMEKITSGATTFDDLVKERGLDLNDVDYGAHEKSSLLEGGDEIFAAEIGTVVGPITTDIGATLFRVNGILEGRNIPFETAKTELLPELQSNLAFKFVEDQLTDLEDRLAAGATLEDLANETDMILAKLDYTAEMTDTIAQFGSFREAVASANVGDYPEIFHLEDGSLASVRIDEVIPAQEQTLEQAKARVIDDWKQEERIRRAIAKGAEIKAKMQEGQTFESFELVPTSVTAKDRTTPTATLAPAFIADIFKATKGEIVATEDFDGVLIGRVDDIIPADLTSESSKQLIEIFSNEARQTVNDDLLGIYGTAVQRREGVLIDQKTIDAVNVRLQ